MAVSTRTCIGCRRRAETPELVRLTLVDGQIAPAARAGRLGRGASIHPREACVVAAVKTQAFARAFRAPIGKELNMTDAVRAFIKDIEIAHVLQQPRAGRTP